MQPAPILAVMDPQGLRDLLLVAAAYLAGSLPMGVIVARLVGARDPRTVGSGRTGGTNVLRAMGARAALVVAALDIAKGAVPVLVARFLDAGELTQAIVGVAAVLGSWRSAFLRFGGGRGVATGIGAMLVIQPLAIVISAPIFFAVVALSRYVSLASLLGSAAAAGLLGLFVAAGVNRPVSLVYGLAAAALIWIAHADNIERLLQGRESRFSPMDREVH